MHEGMKRFRFRGPVQSIGALAGQGSEPGARHVNPQGAVLVRTAVSLVVVFAVMTLL
jgi:hypothetical protein